MFKIKKVLLFLSLVLSLLSEAGEVAVTSVTARQRTAWDGLVDIAVTIQGTTEDVAKADCFFSAMNSATRAAIPVAHITRTGNDLGSGATWTRKFTWDAKADIGAAKIDDVVLTVDAKVLGGVQLWENGPYWAECNVGATKPEEYGYYFWWGDTVGCKREGGSWNAVDGSRTGFSFSSGNCPTYDKNNSQLRSEGYIDATGNLVAAYDAATAHLGAPWRMPTDAEFSALINNCDTEWTSCNGVPGQLVKGRGTCASKSIFLPAAGFVVGASLNYLGSNGYCWSSSSHSGSSDSAWELYFISGGFYRSSYGRYGGQSVRPVRGFAGDGIVVSGGVTTHLSVNTSIVVTGVTAQQRYPWNGLVDVTVTLQGSADDLLSTECTFVATNSATKAAISVEHITRNGTDSGSDNVWTRKYIWDVKSDVGAVKIDDVALSVVDTFTGVQLWENGPCWAVSNVGAAKPEEYGYYFWWGDTIGCKWNGYCWDAVDGSRSGSSFHDGNCPTYGKNDSQLLSEGYIDAMGNLVADYDAATAYLGAPWRMPTDEEFSLLIDNCDAEWTSRNGVFGLLVKGRGAYSSKGIFLPAAGYGLGGLGGLGLSSNFWTSSPDSGSSVKAWVLCFESDHFSRFGSGDRRDGLSVRPVRGFTGEGIVAPGGVTTHLSVDNRVVTSVTAQQRYPWNGLVDVTVTLQGTAEDVSKVDCLFAAANSATKVAIPVVHIMRNGVDSGTGTAWTRKFIWDAKADVGAVKIDDITLTVDAEVSLGGVQLWENGPFWAECNVGATKPEEYGYYFWWGDTVGYKRNGNSWDAADESRTGFSFCDGNCPTRGKDDAQLQSEGYINAMGNLATAHDAATAYLGAPWRMPTDAEFSALINNCDMEWTSRNGVSGRLVKGRGTYASKSIFLPAAGYGLDSHLYDLGSYCHYWSSPPFSGTLYAWGLYSSSHSLGREFTFRIYGQSVRPVRGFAGFATDLSFGAMTHLPLDCRMRAKVADSTRPLAYDAAWYEGGATAKVAVDGQKVVSGAAGTYAWMPTSDGVNLLTLNVYNDSDEVVGKECVFFLSREDLAELVIPDGATEIGEYAFAGGQFTSVTIPNSVTNVAATAFAECKNIVSLVAPAWVNVATVFADSKDKIAYLALSAQGDVPASAYAGCSAIQRVDVGSMADWLLFRFGNAESNPLHTGAALYVGGEEVAELEIPDGTTEIGEYAFAGGQFTSVTIPNSVTNVAPTAFAGCENIVEVSLGSGLSGVDECTLATLFPGSYGSIRSVQLDDGFTEIGRGMFAGCASLEAFAVPPGVTRIGADAFLGCDAIKRVDVASFDQWMFLEFENENANPLVEGATLYVNGQPFGSGASVVGGLTILDGWVVDCEDRGAEEVVVPEGVVGIGRGAFAGMYDLADVSLPSSLRYIGERAFAECTYLDGLVIPDGVEIIASGAFEDCSWMQTITIGRGVRTVGARAFAGCTRLAKATFADGLETVGDGAFENCWRMMSVSLPASVTAVSPTAFADCDSLTGVMVPSGVAPLSEWFAPVYRQIKDVTVPSGEVNVCPNMFKDCTALEGAVLPDGVTNVSEGAFWNCTKLPLVVLPSTLVSIGDDAFRNCDAFEAAGIPDNVVRVGARAFYDCGKLKDVSLSKKLVELCDQAFDACPSLDSLYIPASVAQLGARVFGNGLSAAYFLGNAPSYDAAVYASTKSGLTTYVHYGTKGWDGRPTSRDLPQRWPTDNSYSRAIQTWEPVQLDVTFDAGEGVFAPVAAHTYACEQIVNTAYSLPPFNPTRKGYKFAGWWTEATGGTQVTPSMGVKLASAHTLYAHWAESVVVKVRFNACGGTVVPEEMEYTAEVPFGTFPVPTREHYVFTGWYTAASGGALMRESAEVPRADRELFAHWTPAHYLIRFNANNGSGATVGQDYIYGQTVTLRANTFGCAGCQFAGWSLTPGGEAVYADCKTVSEFAAIEDGVIDLYAVWTGNVYAVRFDSHGGMGVMPNQTFVLGVSQKLSHCTCTRSGYVFKGWALSTTAEVSYGDGEEVCNLTASKNATVVLFAVWERDSHGEWTVAEYLNCTNLTFTLGGNTPLWYGEKVTRADKVGMMRSGAIGDSQTNWIETVVTGAGQIGFWWKASGEYQITKKVVMRYDYAEFTIDGVPVEEIGDESDWTYVTIPVEGSGSHVLRWMYHKDESGFDGDDCAWLSEVSWVPTQVAEPIPELPENPTADDVQLALAGSADSQLFVHVTDAATYDAYREWALKIGATDVKASPFAWASFATDSAALLAKMPTDEDLKVEEFKPSVMAGSFDFTVSVKDVTIGDKASVDNLKKLFGLEGAESLDAAAFSSDNVAPDFKEPQDGKLKFTATPAVDNAKSFFMKVKIK